MSAAPRRLRLTAGNESYAVDVPPSGALRVAGCGEPVAVTRLDRSTFEVTAGENRMIAYAAEADGRWWVFADGCAFAFQAAPAGIENRPESGRAGRQPVLAAPMPATVVALHAAPGMSVRRDDALVVLEAMKMELSIRAPCDGVVASVSCRQGDLVEPGVPLVALRPESE